MGFTYHLIFKHQKMKTSQSKGLLQRAECITKSWNTLQHCNIKSWNTWHQNPKHTFSWI